MGENVKAAAKESGAAIKDAADTATVKAKEAGAQIKEEAAAAKEKATN